MPRVSYSILILRSIGIDIVDEVNRDLWMGAGIGMEDQHTRRFVQRHTRNELS